MLELSRLPSALAVGLKIDAGMDRLGFSLTIANSVRARLDSCPSVAPHMRLMSHLAAADYPGDQGTGRQIAAFSSINFSGERSLANSAGVIGWPATHADWVRPGIMLYGLSPMTRGTGAMEGLRPVMTLKSKLISVKDMHPANR